MARSAETDRRIYAHALDAGIVAGVVTIVLHIVLSMNGVIVMPMIYTGLGVLIVALVVGTYFLKRRKDGP